MTVTRSTQRALLVVGVAAVLVAGTVSAAALWQRHERQRLAAVTARLDVAVTALERERRPLPSVRDEDNAAPALLAAARGIPASCRRNYPRDIHELLGRPVGAWTPAERAAIPPSACAASLEALRAAAARPQVAFPPVLAEVVANPRERSALVTLLDAGRLLSLDARQAAETGKRDRLAADWSALMKIGTGLAREDSLVVGIIANPIETLELRLVLGLLESRRLPVELATELRQHLQARAEYGDAMARSLAAEVRLWSETDEPRPPEPWIIARLASGMECGFERLLPHVEASWIEIERVIDAPPARCVDDEFSKIMLVHLRDAYPPLRATDAARQLAIVALTVYERGASVAAERVLEGVSLAGVPNRYTGERVEVETASRNTLLLRYPEAERRARASDPGRPQPPFAYRLPRRGS